MGIIGGFFYPSSDPLLRVAGSLLWVCGNGAWLIFAHGEKKWALFTLQFVYMLQNVFAVWWITRGTII
jgi:hypothetical protein